MRRRFHRFLSCCVVALLMGNALAIGLMLADDDVATRAESPARTLTLITTADGRRILVDPNTDAGRQAIADAQRNGSTITQVPVPTTSSTVASSQATLPTLPPVDGILPIDPGSVLDDTINTLLDTVTTVSSMVGGSVTTVSSIVSDTQSTIANVSTTVDEVVTTVSSTVSTVVTTVSTSVGGVVTTVTTVLNQLGSTGSDPATTTVDSQPICALLAC